MGTRFPSPMKTERWAEENRGAVCPPTIHTGKVCFSTSFSLSDPNLSADCDLLRGRSFRVAWSCGSTWAGHCVQVLKLLPWEVIELVSAQSQLGADMAAPCLRLDSSWDQWSFCLCQPVKRWQWHFFSLLNLKFGHIFNIRREPEESCFAATTRR